MPTNQQDVELRIRARDTSKSDLKELIATLRSLRSAQKEQVEAAQQGEASARELEQSYRKLENVGKSLLKQQGLITQWKNQSQALDEARARTQEARQQLAAYERQMEQVAKTTRDQNAELKNRERELKSAEKSESAYEVQIGKTADRLEKYGISLSRLDQDQRRVRDALRRTNQALDTQDQAIEGYEANLRQLKQVEQERVAQAQRSEQALREQEASVNSLAAAEERRKQDMRDVENQRQTTLQENEAREYSRWWEQALEQREQQERDAAARVQQIREEEAAQAQRQANDYKRFWAQALDQIEQQEREAASQQAMAEKLREQRQEMQRLADEAMQTRRAYTGVASGLQQVTSAATPAASAVRAVLSPTTEAVKSIDRLEEQVDTLADSIRKIDGPVDDLKGQMNALSASQKEVSRQAGLVDGFNRQMVTLRRARSEYTEARADVRRLAEAMRTMDEPTAEMNAEMQQAQTRLRSASSAMQKQTGEARKLRQELKQAGIETRDLANEEQRLIGIANRSASAVEGLQSAHNRYGHAVDRSSTALDRWARGQRTTLGLIERVRGELIALAASYAGIQGAVELAGNAVDRFKKQQQLEQILTVANDGDMQQVKDDLEYINAQADRLGYSYLTLGRNYAKFATAAKAAGFSQQETRFTFENVIETARAQNMSDDQTTGILKALEQMVSKGFVQADELKEQLGDRLPGAIATFAEATGRTIPELVKAMENSEVAAREVIDAARQMGEDNQEALVKAMDGVQAAEGRLANAMDRFYIGLAESGFIDQYTDLLNETAAYLQTEEGQEFAEDLGHAFEDVAQSLKWVINNLETMKSVLSVIVTIAAVRYLVAFVGALRGVIAAGAEVAVMLRGLPALFARGGASAMTMGASIRMAAKIGARAIPLIGTALIAWDIGEIMYQQSDTFASAVDYVVLVWEKLNANVKKYVASTAGAIQDVLTGAIRALGDHVSEAAAYIANTMAGLLDKVPGSEDMAESLRNWGKDLTAEQRDFWSEYNRQWEEGQAQLDAADERYQEKIRKRHQKTQSLVEQAGGRATYPDTADPGRGVTPEERAANALTAQLDRIDKKLEKTDFNSRMKAARDDLQAMMALVEEEFEPMREQASQLSGQDRVEAEARIEELIGRRKEEVRREYNTRLERQQGSANDKRLRAAQSLQNKLAQMENGLATNRGNIDPDVPFLDRMQAALDEVKQKYEEVYQEADKLAKLGDEKGAQDARARLDAMRETALEQARMETGQEELSRLQDNMNAQLQLRQTLLSTVNKLRDAGLISEEESVRRTNEINDNMGKIVDKAQQAVREFAQMHPELMSDVEYQQTMAQLDGIRASVVNVGQAYTDLDKTIAQSLANNGTTAIDDMATAMGELALGTRSLSGTFQAVGAAAAQFFAQLLRDIALAIIRQQILNMIVAMNPYSGIGQAAASLGGQAGGQAGGFMSQVATGGVAHEGGVVGSTVNTSRSVPASYFANAPRFHSGGLPGLSKGETPIIAQEGEEVLTKDDPRNVLNGGKGRSGGEGNGNDRGLSMVLVDDHRDMVAAMASSAGDEVIFQYLKRNKRTVRQLVNMG